MLRLQNVSLARGTRVLYQGATLIASPSERIGLVGPNGCGKSTLFAAILGEITTEAGDIECPPQERIAHVAQSFKVENVKTLDFVLAGHEPLMRARAKLAELQAQPQTTEAYNLELAQAMANLAELNEGAIVAQAQMILAGLGFTSAWWLISLAVGVTV